MTREEAINEIKSWDFLEGKEIEAIHTLIPELRESEDERIRKEIIDFIQWAEDRGMTRHDYHQAKRPAVWIAYLEKQKDERELGYIEGKVEGVRQTCQEIKDAMSLFEPKDLTPFEFTFRDYIDSAIRYCLSGEGYQQYIKEWSADLLNLEKQKEQKPRWEINNPHTTKWTKEMIDEKFEELVEEYHKQKPVVTHGETYHVDTLGTQQVIAGKMPQKPAEWSEDWREEDIQTRFAFYTYKDDSSVLYLSNVFVEETSRNHGFGTRILRAAEKVAETIGATTISLKVKQDSPANAWYRKNGYGYVAFEDGYDWLEKNLEYMKPNKQEWSEEDEEMLNSCICSIEESKENRYAYKENDGDTSYDREIAWLKSLRPSWKPSEEQMEALEYVIRDYREDSCNATANYLQEILDHLKNM